MQKTWVLVADTSRARVFTVEKPVGPLSEVETLVHTEARLHEQELTSDQRPGRNTGRTGTGGHSMGYEDDPKRQEHIRFAREISEFLERAHGAHRFERLYIVAAPAFLGDLRQTLAKTVTQSVSAEVPKNVTRLEAADIRGHLPDFL